METLEEVYAMLQATVTNNILLPCYTSYSMAYESYKDVIQIIFMLLNCFRVIISSMHACI